MRNSRVVMLTVSAIFFGVSVATGFGQILKNLPIERTVEHRSTTYGFDGEGTATLDSADDGEGMTSKVMSPARISVDLPKSVGAPVLIEAKVYQLDLPVTGKAPKLTVAQALAQIAAGQHRLIAEPSMVGSSGNLSVFQSVVNVRLAREFSPPTIPKSYKGAVRGGETVGEKAAVKTNDSEVILPAHPTKFENQDIGLTLKLTPKIGRDGSVSVFCDAENSALGPFADRGKEILRDTKKPIGKKMKTTVLLDNNQYFPTILKQKAVFSASGQMGRSASKLAGSVSGSAQFSAEHGTAQKAAKFAELVVKDGLPPLLISVSARRINVAKPAKKNVVNNETQIFLTLRAVETSNELGVIAGVPNIGLGILTDPQFQVLIRSLNSKKGVDLLTAPSIMLSGENAGKIEVIREFVYPASYGAPKIIDSKSGGEKGSLSQAFPITPATPLEFATMNTGIEFGVMARCVDGNSIELQLRPEVTEFKGFLNFGEPIVLHDHQKAFGKQVSVVMTENRIEMPVFDKRRLETTVRIPNGGVVCLGGFVSNEVQDVEDKVPLLGDMPLVGKAFRKEVELHIQKRLYFFVRAELMDPAGVPISKE